MGVYMHVRACACSRVQVFNAMMIGLFCYDDRSLFCYNRSYVCMFVGTGLQRYDDRSLLLS